MSLESTLTTGVRCGSVSGFYSCSASLGGGCCPVGFVCVTGNACLPSTSTVPTTTENADASTDASESESLSSSATTVNSAVTSRPDLTTDVDASSGTAPEPSTTGPVECAGHGGYFACPERVGGDCCPFGYLCDADADVQCLLTLRLNEVTETRTTGEGSARAIVTTVFVEGPSVTAANRIASAGPDTSTPSSSVTTSMVPPNTASSGLTGSEIGGVVGGVIGGVLLLAAGLFFLFRLRKKKRQAAEGADANADPGSGKQELDGKDAQVSELGGDARASELPGERSTMQHELVGSYGAHGISELDATPREQRSSRSRDEEIRNVNEPPHG